MNQRIFLTGAIALLLAGNANAQDAAAGAADSGVTLLDKILVSEGLTAIEQEKSGRAFTVITGEQLEKNQVRYLVDALRLVPGVAVSRRGSVGSTTQLRMRGAEGNHVLVMIDGVEVSEMSTGEFDFSSLLVNDIDRIEVLRGPQSAFWGSNATAGVINVITRRGERNGFRTDARTEAGTDGTVLGAATLSGGRENYDVALSAAFRRTDGFNISDFGDERDGDRNATLNARFAADLTPDLAIDGTVRFVDRHSEVDPQVFFGEFAGLVTDGDDWTSTRDLVGSLGATYVSLDGALTQKARLSGSDSSRENYADGVTASDNGVRYNGSYQASYQFATPGLLDARHQLTGGYEWEQENFSPSHLPETFERSTNSFVGEYRGEFLDQIYVNAGIRHDLNDRFEDATTWSLSGAWKIPGTATRLHASVGTGVTNPTFYEQFGFFPGTFVGNPNLVPEESTGFDIGIEQGFFDDRLIVDVTYFNQDLTNEIRTVFGGAPDFLQTVINGEGASKREGIEIAATVDLLNGFTARASYTYTDATEQTIAGGPRLEEIRRPRHSGSLSTAYVFDEDRARVFGEIVFNGEMIDTVFVPTLPPRVTLDSYTIVNIGGSYRFNERLEAFGRIENLFDEDYEEVFGYNAQGRTAFIGVKGTF